ncbi:hypothetical protein [Halorhabdus sp. BNX81]|uniref:hypothetical protein n=1 Tax=Halorhabdus sp. BNX81 TaxID=2980181 RepID=UPI0023DD273A|nr:hypothetical protein [Halorhabdus sp. BNX81]
MDVQQIRLQLYRIPVRMTIASEFRDFKDWNDEEIEEIKSLMAESFNDRAGTLFYRNGGVILVTYLLIDNFVSDLPIGVLGMTFILYGATLAGYSIKGPYRIAVEGLEKEERYDILKREMARDTMLVTMGAIFFVAGFSLRIITSAL